MGVRRYVGELRKQGSESPGDALYGMAFYHAADVDALLVRIRTAVAAMDEAWRILAEGEHLVGVCDDDTAELADRQAGDDIDAARAALDALLADGGA